MGLTYFVSVYWLGSNLVAGCRSEELGVVEQFQPTVTSPCAGSTYTSGREDHGFASATFKKLLPLKRHLVRGSPW